jgi:hypothetical protein
VRRTYHVRRTCPLEDPLAVTGPAGPAREAASGANAPPAVRPVIPLMRVALFTGALLVSLAGIQLYFLTTRTAHYFAWTITVPMTAAFLGAFYWTALPLALLSALERVWIRARVGIPGVLLFLWATLATTLIHHDKFHFHSADHFARGAAWLWLVIYAADPVLISVALVIQISTPGADPPRAALLPSWYRAAVGAQAVISLGIGAAMFANPMWVARWWPWPLTPLTARAMASWILGLGGVLAMAFWENDWIRIRIATISYTVLGILQLVALARYSGGFTWGWRGSLYTALVASVLLLGVYGLAQAARAGRRFGAATRD